MSAFLGDLYSFAAGDAAVAVLLIAWGTLFVAAYHWYGKE
jgi:hypothetical protein